jgi:hypothetical protein
MNITELANRRTELLRKRYAGTIESDEQDELDDITDALRLWSESMRPVLQVVTAGDEEN